MSVHINIQAALIEHLITPPLAGNPAIAMPFVDFTPPATGGYLEVRPILRAEPDHPGRAPSDSTLLRGIFQVDAVLPTGEGEAPGLALAQLVADRFAMGTELTNDSHLVRISGVPGIAGAIADAPWVRFPVSVPFLLIA